MKKPTAFFRIKDDGIDAVVKYLDYIEKSGYAIDKSCFDIVDFVIKEAGKERFIITKSPNLFPSGMSWFPLFLEMLYLEPEITQRLFDVYLQKALAVIKQYIQLGTDCILICGDWAYNSGPFVSPEMIRKFFVPQIKAIADLCHKNNVYVMKHTDGNIMKIADDFFTMGIDAYNSVQPDAGMSLALVKQLYGDKITFMGNVDCGRTLQFGSKEKIIEETKQCIRDAAHGGGFILSSDNSIYSGIPAENFITMIETARKYGNYPIKV